MSIVLRQHDHKTHSSFMESGSLLEHLYTFFTLKQLHELLDNHPGDETLRMWRIELEEYKAQVHIAIAYVMRD